MDYTKNINITTWVFLLMKREIMRYTLKNLKCLFLGMNKMNLILSG